VGKSTNFVIRDICKNGLGLRAPTPIRNADIRAGVRQQSGHSGADPSRAAGNKCALSLQ
jgi:hypothetical protein